MNERNFIYIYIYTLVLFFTRNNFMLLGQKLERKNFQLIGKNIYIGLKKCNIYLEKKLLLLSDFISIFNNFLLLTKHLLESKL